MSKFIFKIVLGTFFEIILSTFFFRMLRIIWWVCLWIVCWDCFESMHWVCFKYCLLSLFCLLFIFSLFWVYVFESVLSVLFVEAVLSRYMYVESVFSFICWVVLSTICWVCFEYNLLSLFWVDAEGRLSLRRRGTGEGEDSGSVNTAQHSDRAEK